MKAVLRDTETLLKALRIEVRRGAFRSASKNKRNQGWGGADVVFALKGPDDKRESSFYPPPRYVITPYAHEAGWLLRKLRDAFAPLIDGCTKIEFFGRLANAALRYQEKLGGAPERSVDLLNAILDESETILDEMTKGEFMYLAVAVGNTIADDFKSR